MPASTERPPQPGFLALLIFPASVFSAGVTQSFLYFRFCGVCPSATTHTVTPNLEGGRSLVFFKEQKIRLSPLYSEPRGWACDPHGRGPQLRPHPPSRSLVPCSRDLEGFLQPARISATGPGMRSPGPVERLLPAHPVRGGWSRCRRWTEAAAHGHSGVPCSRGDRRWPWSA